MLKRNNTPSDANKIMVSIEELQDMLSVGRNTAKQIGIDAGASVKVGRRRLYNVSKIEEYMNRLTEA
jgi:hypothetical protein